MEGDHEVGNGARSALFPRGVRRAEGETPRVGGSRTSNFRARAPAEVEREARDFGRAPTRENSPAPKRGRSSAGGEAPTRDADEVGGENPRFIRAEGEDKSAKRSQPTPQRLRLSRLHRESWRAGAVKGGFSPPRSGGEGAARRAQPAAATSAASERRVKTKGHATAWRTLGRQSGPRAFQRGQCAAPAGLDTQIMRRDSDMRLP